MAEFQKVLKKSDVPEGTAKKVPFNGRDVAVFNIGGSFYALDNACPHRGGPLAEGDISGKQVTCPWHAWEFDVTTGAASHTASSAKCYQVKVEGDDIYVGA